MGRRRLQAVALGAGSALAVALPAALVAQAIDATADGGIGAGWLGALTVVVVIGIALGGWVAGRQQVAPPAALAAAAGLAATFVVQSAGVARRLAAGDDVAWATVPVVLAAGAGLAALSGAIAARRATRQGSAAGGARGW